jgi:hypothetical protein
MKYFLNLKNIKWHVGVDHFYVGFSPEEIQDLKKLARLPHCQFRKTTSGKNSWSGVYWHSTNLDYFEMVESPVPGHYQFGVALSARHNHHTDIRALVKLYKGAKKLSVEPAKLAGKNWFDYIFAGPGTHISASFWAMYYHLADRVRSDRHLRRPSLIERFTELQLRASPKILDDLDKYAYWVPMERKRRGNLVTLTLLRKDSSPFVVKIHLDKSTEFTTLISLRGQCSPFQVKLPKLKLFNLRVSNGYLELSPKSITSRNGR